MTIQEWRRKLAILQRAERVARAKSGPWLTPFDAPAVYAAVTAAEDALRAHWDAKPKGWGS